MNAKSKSVKLNQEPLLKQPFSNIQLELLKLYADNIPDADLIEIKRIIGRYFAQKATAEADKIWDEKGYTAEAFLNEHMRTPYRKH